MTTRIDPVEFFSLRSTASNGFRAPGVHQLCYSQTLTNLVDGELVETGAVANDSPVAQAFGIKPLVPETSYGFSVGAVFKPDVWLDKPTRTASLTADFFMLKIRDRIVLSESIDGAVPDGGTDDARRMQARQLLADNRLGAAQFFTNAVDTSTIGCDIVGTRDAFFSQLFGSKLSAALSLVKTQIDGTHSQSSLLVEDDELFGETQRLRLESGQPRVKFIVASNVRAGNFTLRLSSTYYGSVSGQTFTGARRDWSGKWITDALAYRPQFAPGLAVTLGGNNVFDVYPDEWGSDAGDVFYEAGFIYGWETLPFGINGGLLCVIGLRVLTRPGESPEQLGSQVAAPDKEHRVRGWALVTGSLNAGAVARRVPRTVATRCRTDARHGEPHVLTADSLLRGVDPKGGVLAGVHKRVRLLKSQVIAGDDAYFAATLTGAAARDDDRLLHVRQRVEARRADPAAKADPPIEMAQPQ